MLELRILSGLHRGATLPLNEEELVIGSDETADVVLLDPGIELGAHARLRPSGEGWVLAGLDGEVRGADTNMPLDMLDLGAGEFGRIGRVWIALCNADAAWTEPPDDPVDIDAGELAGEDGVDDDDEGDGDGDGDADASDTDGVDDAEDQAGPEPATEPAAAPVAKPQEAPEVAGMRRLSLPQMVLAGLGVLTVLAAFSAYFLTGSSPESAPFKPGITSAALAPAVPAAATAPDLAPEQLRAAFRKRLAEVDLLKRFDLNLRDDGWHLQAALDDEEAARFERTLAAFVAQHRINFPINAKIGNAEHMLPFKIRQVISGANASVVTLEGVRLYVGDEYQGVRLLSVQGSRLVFGGKRRIEVRW